MSFISYVYDELEGCGMIKEGIPKLLHRHIMHTQCLNRGLQSNFLDIMPAYASNCACCCNTEQNTCLTSWRAKVFVRPDHPFSCSNLLLLFKGHNQSDPSMFYEDDPNGYL